MCLRYKDQSVNVAHEKPKLTVRISRNTRIHFIDIILTKLNASQTGTRNQVGNEVYLFSKTSRTALESARSPIQLAPGTLSLTVEGPGCDVNHSPPSHAEVKIMCFHDLYHGIFAFIWTKFKVCSRKHGSVYSNIYILQAQISKLSNYVGSYKFIPSMSVGGKVSAVAALLIQGVRSSYSGRTVGAFLSPGEMPVQYR